MYRWRRAPANPYGAPRRRSGGRFILAAALAVMAVLGYFSQRSENEITGETQYVALSREQEVALGLQAAPEMAAQFGGVVDHPLAAYVDEIGERVAEGVGERGDLYDYEFHVLADQETVNAFALPGGQIFVTLAMLRSLGSEAELAGVLGHEIGHVAGRHQLKSLRYSRSDELESDELGVKLMSASGYDPSAMIGVMKALARASGRSEGPEFFQMHPNPENRIARLKRLVEAYRAAPGGGELGEERYRDEVLLPLGETRAVRGRD